MAKLNDRQDLFCSHYVSDCDLNAAKAARLAGYSEKSARSTANHLMSNPDIKRRISDLMANRSKRLLIDSDYVLTSIRDTVERCKGNDNNEFDPANCLRGSELSGRHLAMWTDKVIHSNDLEKLDRTELLRKLAESEQEYTRSLLQ